LSKVQSYIEKLQKKLQKLPAARTRDRDLELRKEKIEECEALPNMEYTKICEFIDEAGFNLHIQINYGRSQKGTTSESKDK
jgi:hypothetical protein